MNIKFLQQKFRIFILLVFISTITSGCGTSPEQSAMAPNIAQIPGAPNGPASSDGSAMPPNGTSTPVQQAPSNPVQDVVIRINNQLKQISKPLKTPVGAKKVIIDVDTFGRDNPFKPFYQKSVVASSVSSSSSVPNLPNSVMYPISPGRGVPRLPRIDNSLPKLSMYGVNIDAPSPEGDVDPSISSLMGIKVAGILYDSTKPMAILNINGDDQLVQRGDKFMNYVVTDITRSKVCVRKGHNTFRAGIGQIIDGQVYDNSQYYNVKKHFAGSKRYVINTETNSNYY